MKAAFPQLTREDGGAPRAPGLPDSSPATAALQLPGGPAGRGSGSGPPRLLLSVDQIEASWSAGVCPQSAGPCFKSCVPCPSSCGVSVTALGILQADTESLQEGLCVSPMGRRRTGHLAVSRVVPGRDHM